MSKEGDDFKICVPVNTLVGADYSTFKAIMRKEDVEKGYRHIYHISKVICKLLNLFIPINNRRYEKLVANKEIEKAPVFILGHWRSGTTMVHNLMAQDSQFGYCTTYQTVFPHMMLFGQSFFKKAMSLFMPKERATDGVKLGVDLPQEEEFALSNMTPYNYYNFWIMPKKMVYYSDKYLLMKSAEESEIDGFKSTMERLIKLSMHNTGGQRFLSKNPPHTGRVKELLEMFPDAKFVYLMRDPYTVIASTISFFSKTIKPLQMQRISKKELEENVLKVYVDLYERYNEEKSLIPKGNLIEIKFEDFEADGMSAVERVYKDLSLEGYEDAKGGFMKYLDGQKKFEKNRRRHSVEFVEWVNRRCESIIKEWNYTKE